jgi:hypothetical protein
MASGTGQDVGLDSHVRYLSGLLLAIGGLFWSIAPSIERQTACVRVLTIIVVTGGLARLFGVAHTGASPPSTVFGLSMELIMTPLICVWQSRVSRRFRDFEGSSEHSI